MKQEVNNNLAQRVNVSYVKKRGFKLFLIRFSYMLVFTLAITYTLARISGETILQAITSLSIIFTLPILFIIGFALAMWRFWYSIVYFAIATFLVNALFFSGELGGIGGAAILAVIEVPIFLIFTFFVFALEKGFSAIPIKWLRWTLAILPFVIMIGVVIGAAFTCSFNNNVECVTNKALDSGMSDDCSKLDTYKQRNCYSAVALRDNDYMTCFDMDNTYYLAQESCVRQVFENLESAGNLNSKVCNTAPQNKKDLCYMALAVVKVDPSICDEKLEEGYYCYEYFAKKTGDISFCERISDEVERDRCLINLASIDPSACERVQSYNRGRCYNFAN